MTTVLLPRPRQAKDRLAAWGTAYRAAHRRAQQPVERITAEEHLERLTLHEFVRRAWPIIEGGRPFRDNWHIGCVCEHLQAVHDGQLRDVVFNFPPRMSKSTVISVCFCPWEWTLQPELRYLYTSYALSLSVRDSVKARRLVAAPWYQAHWGRLVKLTTDQNQKLRFENTRTGARLASSVGGTGTGEGGDRIVADDPHNVKNAESDVIRTDTVNWWDEVMSTRGNDPQTVARIIVMQRTHHQDLTGHLMREGGYHLVVLPMHYHPPTLVEGTDLRDATKPQPHDLVECPLGATRPAMLDPRTTEGELLDPVRFPEAEVTKLAKRLKAYAAVGQLEQRPTAREGAILKDTYFRPLPPDIDVVPDGQTKSLRQRLLLFQHWDLAWSKKTSADHTACATVGLDPGSGNVYLTHVWRGREDKGSLAALMADTIGSTRPHMVSIEKGAYQQPATLILMDELGRALLKKKVAIPFTSVDPVGDKVLRAQLPATLGSVGRLFADRTAPWWNDFWNECASFPLESEDDQVDALSGACKLAIEHYGEALDASTDEPVKPQDYSLKEAPDKKTEGDWEWAEDLEDEIARARLAAANAVVDPAAPAEAPVRNRSGRVTDYSIVWDPVTKKFTPRVKRDDAEEEPDAE